MSLLMGRARTGLTLCPALAEELPGLRHGALPAFSRFLSSRRAEVAVGKLVQQRVHFGQLSSDDVDGGRAVRVATAGLRMEGVNEPVDQEDLVARSARPRPARDELQEGGDA